MRREKWALKGKTPVVARQSDERKTVEDFIENEANDSHKLTVCHRSILASFFN